MYSIILIRLVFKEGLQWQFFSKKVCFGPGLGYILLDRTGLFLGPGLGFSIGSFLDRAFENNIIPDHCFHCYIDLKKFIENNKLLHS